jgi:ribulose-phosphate 3-epimerase
MESKNSFKISASILAADFRHLEQDIREAEMAGVDAIHVDVMDGVFVPNISMGPMIVETCRRITSLPIDVHLMIIHPEKFIETFQKAGANSISIHIEENPLVGNSIDKIRKLGCQPGLVINPETRLDEIDDYLVAADHFLVMTVHPGFGGQTFMEGMLEKIRSLKFRLDRLHLAKIIQVDGGIDCETGLWCFKAGARDFVAGHSIFNHPEGIGAGVGAIRSMLE